MLLGLSRIAGDYFLMEKTVEKEERWSSRQDLMEEREVKVKSVLRAVPNILSTSSLLSRFWIIIASRYYFPAHGKEGRNKGTYYIGIKKIFINIERTHSKEENIQD